MLRTGSRPRERNRWSCTGRGIVAGVYDLRLTGESLSMAISQYAQTAIRWANAALVASQGGEVPQWPGVVLTGILSGNRNANGKPNHTERPSFTRQTCN